MKEGYSVCHRSKQGSEGGKFNFITWWFFLEYSVCRRSTNHSSIFFPR